MATQNYFKVKNGLEFPSIETLQTTDNTGPSVKPNLNLDFAKTKTLDPRITFTRSSTATYYDGETSAKAEENLFYYSQDQSQSAYTKGGATFTYNSTAPDGTSTATKIVPSAIVEGHAMYAWVQNAINGLTYTASMYVKSAGYRYVAITDAHSASLGRVVVDVIDGFITQNDLGTAAIAYVGNGWYRVRVTYTESGGGTALQLSVHAVPTIASAFANTNYFAGDGTSGIYTWGWQAEQRSYATAYTPTTSTLVINRHIPVLQTAGANIARFDHDPVTGESKGLLIEEARTNLLSYSNDLAHGPYFLQSRATIAQNCIVAPDGTVTAHKLAEDTQNGAHYMYANNVPITANTAYTFSIFIKAAERASGRLEMTDGTGTNGARVYFNLLSGTVSTLTNIGTGVGSNPTITDVGNGWYRVTLTTIVDSSSTAMDLVVYTDNDTDTTAIGYAGTTGYGLYVWGVQLEVGTIATSYIPTPLTYVGRGSTATYKAADGLIRAAAANVARYEHNAFGGRDILLESARTNLLANSDLYGNLMGAESIYTKVNNSSDVMAPDGSMLTTKLIVGSTGNTWFWTIPSAGTYAANTVYTHSVWLRTTVGATCSIGLQPYPYTYTTNCAVTDKWQRFQVTFTTDASGTSPYVGLVTPSFNSIIYVWGWQVEAGSSASSYIPSVQTFTGRSSTATYYDSTGIIRTAASGQPRYTYNPSLLSAAPKLLLEATATNLDTGLSTYAGQVSVSITANAATAPDGTTTAYLLTNTSSSNPVWYRSPSLAANIYTYSVYVKAANQSLFTLRIDTPSIGINAFFDLSTGTITGTVNAYNPTITYVGNGWYRCSVTTPGSYGITNQVLISNFASSAASIYVWGAQLEVGYGMTSYIPTSGSQVTRAADTSTSTAQTRAADVYSSSQVTRSIDLPIISTSSLNTFYRQDEGTFAVEWYDRAQSATHQLFSVFDLANGNNRINLAPNNANVLDGAVVVNGVDYVDSLTPTVVAGYHKAAFAYKLNDSAITMDGASTISDTTCMLPNSVQQMTIGISAGSTQPLNSTMKRLVYYPKRLTNAELVSITA